MHTSKGTDETKPRVLLPKSCYGEGASILRRAEGLWIKLAEADSPTVRCRALGDERVFVVWNSHLMPVEPGFFLPGIGEFMTGNLRPRFSARAARMQLNEAEVLSLLTAKSAGTLLVACAYESSVRSVLSLLTAPAPPIEAILDRPVVVSHQEMTLRDAIAMKWATMVELWLPNTKLVSPHAALERTVDAMRAHQSASREERIGRCLAYVRRDPRMDFVREIGDWETKLDRTLWACDEAQLEYLSECGFWSYARMSTDAAAFRNY